MWNSITEFLGNVLKMIAGGSIGTGSDAITVTGIVNKITSTPALAVFVLAIPIVGVSIAFLQRLVKRTFR